LTDRNDPSLSLWVLGVFSPNAPRPRRQEWGLGQSPKVLIFKIQSLYFFTTGESVFNMKSALSFVLKIELTGIRCISAYFVTLVTLSAHVKMHSADDIGGEASNLNVMASKNIP
jgi:hypothetical protein